MPSTFGLFGVVVNERNDKKYIQIIVAKENEAPYYLKGIGLSLIVVSLELVVMLNR